MSIFDVHIHVQPWEMLRDEVRPLVDDPQHQDAKPLMHDVDALLRFLDANDVERACCINYVSPDVMGFSPAVNDWIVKLVRDHRDRLVAVGSVNPLVTRDTKSEINRILDAGIGMIKIHPPHQLFAPNAYRFELPSLRHVYEECERRGVPVMIHTGTSVFPGARNVYADPMPVDDVAVDFPRLKIIIAHAGRPLYAETAFFLLRRHPNLFTDLSGIPPKRLLQFFPRLREVADKALWGTDWPSPGVTSIAANVADFRALGLGGDIEEKILWSNAVRLFEK
jgi:predicted TIM-barrel fold metal-dependent hydrolase